MFTGIIESLGTIVNITKQGENLYLKIESPLSAELKIDQSVSHNGICMTVVKIENSTHTVCAIPETISKTTINHWRVGDPINLERCMQLNGRLDGHIVQGHVDTVSTCINRIDSNENWSFTFSLPRDFAHLIVEKGSITINGTSLTCFNITDGSFEVAIIPYTYENTSINQVQAGTEVNLEFDIIGKYVARINGLKLSN